MRNLLAIALAVAASAAFAAPPTDMGECMKDPKAAGARASMDKMHKDMERIDATKDRAERQRLMDEHMKHMHEGMGEMRKSGMGKGCRTHMMGAMMDHMGRHKTMVQESPGS